MTQTVTYAFHRCIERRRRCGAALFGHRGRVLSNEGVENGTYRKQQPLLLHFFHLYAFVMCPGLTDFLGMPVVVLTCRHIHIPHD